MEFSFEPGDPALLKFQYFGDLLGNWQRAPMAQGIGNNLALEGNLGIVLFLFFRKQEVLAFKPSSDHRKSTYRPKK